MTDALTEKIDAFFHDNRDDLVQDMEIAIIKNALEQCKFNQRQAAEYLGMTYHQLRGYLVLPLDCSVGRGASGRER